MGGLHFEFADTGDPVIEELYDLIEHEPQRGGVLGVSETEFQSYQNRISSLAAQLRQ